MYVTISYIIFLVIIHLFHTTTYLLFNYYFMFRFDAGAIVREMQKHDLLDALQSLVLGFVDTKPIFKSMLTDRVEQQKIDRKENKKIKKEVKNKSKKKNKKNGFGLTELANDYLDADNCPKERSAAVQVEILLLLIREFQCTDETMKQHVKSFAKFIQSMRENVDNLKADLKPLEDMVSKTMVNNIAKAGISIEELKNTYKSKGKAGVSALLNEEIEGKPRVTNNLKKIQAIVNALVDLLNKRKCA